MIVNKYNQGGGGSGSGMTPQQVQQQIDTSLNPYWDSGETKDYVDEAVSGISLEGYYTSAQTEERISSAYTILDEHITEVEQVTSSAYTELHDGLLEVSARTDSAITMAVSGKADAANVTANNNFQTFARWNSQGVITGAGNMAQDKAFDINGVRFKPLSLEATSWPRIWAPLSAGTAGQILKSNGSGAPVWITPATINGSAITDGGNIEIQGGGITSAQVQTQIDASVSGFATEEYVDERLGREVLNHNSVEELLWDSGIFYEDEYGDTAIAHVPSDEAISYTINQLQESIGEVSGTFTGYTPTTDFATINGSAITEGGNLVIAGGGGVDLSGYYTSAQTEDAISAATAGKADAVSVSGNTNKAFFPAWNEQGIITGRAADNNTYKVTMNGNEHKYYGPDGFNWSFYAPKTSGSAGEFLVADGTSIPKWSAVTIPDMSNYYTSAETFTSAQTQSAIIATTQNMVTSTTITTMWKGTQAEYDTLTNSGATADSGTFYIIIPNNN